MRTFDYPSATYPPRRARPTYPRWLLLALVMLLAFSGWLSWQQWVAPRLTRMGGIDPTAQPREVTPPAAKGGDEQQNINLFRDARGSVVHITTYGLRRDALTRNVQQMREGTGSGFVWDKKGRIVTNYHVIRNADAAQVTLLSSDGKQKKDYTAQIVGVQPEKDLAVLVINAPESELQPIKVGSSHDLQVGQTVYAIGNPFGLDWSLSKGIISALGREIESVAGTPIENVIQTDAAINPGNSGGPLLDSGGRLIGVNTAIYSPSGAHAGIGFAISVDEVNPVATELIRTGRPAARPRLGVQIAPDTFAKRQGVAEGVLVMEVLPNTPAERAGLRPTRMTTAGKVQKLGDVLLSIDSRPIKAANDLFTALAEHKVGETLTLAVRREGQNIAVQVILEAIS